MASATLHTSSAQTPTPTPKPKVAFIRFWNMLPDPKKDTLDLYLASNQLLTRQNGSGNSGYIPVLPNTYTLYTQRPSDANGAPVKTPAVRMLDGSYFTILATAPSGQVTLEVIDDTIDPKTDDGTVRLVVRQFYPGARAVITVGTTPPNTLNFGESAVVDHLPAGQIPLAIQATLPSGPPKSVNLTGNYAKWHHGTVLIVGDVYGRLRPFFTVDGHTDLNLASVMERWLQASTNSPILATPSPADADGGASSDVPAPSKKSRRKARTKHRRQVHKHHSSSADQPDAASGGSH